jgi:hypothetical protein
MMPETIELDLDDFEAVLARAIDRHGPGPVCALIGPAVACGRAQAVIRLWVRRFACGRPGSGMPGEAPSWALAELLDLVEPELERMGLACDPGCRRDDCVVCSARTCDRCGGWACGIAEGG